MAPLATKEDLWALLGEDADTLPPAQADILLEIASAEVRAATKQHLSLLADDELTIMGTTDSWLALPQRPVTAVSLVTLDGDAVTDFTRFGARLWRTCGWAVCASEPSTVTLTYSHGYAADDPALDLARKQTLMLAAHLHANPTSATALSIDDYREQFPQASDGSSGMLPRLAAQLLRRTYGLTVGVARIG
jgi:hypothetical protein